VIKPAGNRIIFESSDNPSISAQLKRASNAVEKRCFEAFFVK
jgi:hypothetical protein